MMKNNRIISIDNQKGKRFHLFMMTFLTIISLIFLFKGKVTGFTYFVIFYSVLVCFFFFRSVELSNDFIYIRYPLRPIFRIQKRKLNSIKKVFFNLEGGGVVAYPNLRFWFSSINLIEIRLDLRKDDIIQILDLINEKSSAVIKCNKANRRVLEKLKKASGIK